MRTGGFSALFDPLQGPDRTPDESAHNKRLPKPPRMNTDRHSVVAAAGLPQSLFAKILSIYSGQPEQ